MILALALLALPAATATAVEVRYEARLLTSYVWRGITLTDDPVFQPSVTVAHANGLSLEVWGNVDLGDDNDTAWELNEVCWTLDYTRRLGRVELAVGAVEYLFPNTPFPGTREIFLRLRVDAQISPELELYRDIDELEGTYARLALTWERELRRAWSLELEGSVGWADDGMSIGPHAGWHDAGLDLRLERALGAGGGAVDLALLAGTTVTLDQKVLPRQPARTWVGVALTSSF